MAFAVWSATDLATFFSSAIEIQDATGLIISRFALNLPSFAGPPPRSRSDAWRCARRSPAAPGGCYAGRLSYHGSSWGDHVYVGDDFWACRHVTARIRMILFRIRPRPAIAIELFAMTGTWP
jgi:hypothetical protein